MLPKLQSIIEFLYLNLSDLCNKISLCNRIDNSAAKNSTKKGRLYKEKENEFVMFTYDTTCKQNATTVEVEFS